MKLKPTIYAQLLIDSMDSKTDTKKVAAGFWRLLQKNNQYKDLAKILAEVEVEYAKKEGKILTKVFSEKALNNAEIADIENKVAAKTGQKVIISNIIKRNWAGIEVVIDDKVIYLSAKGRIEKLAEKLRT